MFACKNKVSIKIADKSKKYWRQTKSNLSNLSIGSERIKCSTVSGMKYEVWELHPPVFLRDPSFH